MRTPQIKPSDGPIALELERRLNGKTSEFGSDNAGSSPAAPAKPTDVPQSARAHWRNAPDNLSLGEARAWALGWNAAIAKLLALRRGSRRQRPAPTPERTERLRAQLEMERERRAEAEKELLRVRRMLKRERRERSGGGKSAAGR